MSCELIRGDKLTIYEANNNTGNLIVYFGWTEVVPKKSFLSMFKNTPTIPVDCDISALLLPDNNKMIEQGDLVFHNNKVHRKSNAVSIIGAPDDNFYIAEQIMVNLDSIPNEYDKIVFIGTIYDADKRKHDFSKLENMYIAIYNTTFNTEVCHFNLVQNYNELTSMFFGEIVRNEFGWEFNALGNGSHDVGIMQAIKRYQA